MPNKTDQERYYERMNEEMDKNEATTQFMWSCIKWVIITFAVLIGIILITALIGTIQVAIFGPYN